MPKQKGETQPHVLTGSPPVTVHLRRSSRARRMSLRVSGLDAKVTLTLPPGVPEADGLAFAAEKQGWLRQQIERHPEVVPVRIGCQLPLLGQPHEVVAAAGRRIQIADGKIQLPGDPDSAGRRLTAYFKTLARDHLVAASDRYVADLKRDYQRISLRDTRSRWGSCSSAGVLMYSWRLIMAPPEVLEYVAAHEVAHLRHMDHSAAFWDQVQELYGDYSAPRLWLRDQGAGLHRYRFDA